MESLKCDLSAEKISLFFLRALNVYLEFWYYAGVYDIIYMYY